MKYSLILSLISGVFLNIPAFSQWSASATASAVIIQPINLLNVRDLNFGRIIPSGSPGTVTLNPTEASTRVVTGGVTLSPGSGTVNSAKFIASGADGISFSIMLPTAPVMLSNGTNFMTIDNFTSTPSGSGTFSEGSQSILVGATLNVNANQEAGVYNSTQDFEVTVNYN